MKINPMKLSIFFFNANARSSGYSLRRGKMIQFIGKLSIFIFMSYMFYSDVVALASQNILRRRRE
jgi:hypothetical protein